MSWLEFIGVAALWVVGTVVLTYVGIGLVAFLTRKGGLETLALLLIPIVGIPCSR